METEVVEIIANSINGFSRIKIQQFYPAELLFSGLLKAIWELKAFDSKAVG